MCLFCYNKEMKTGIIIINYNDAETTIKLINNIRDYKILDHILVLDNCSKDNSYEILKPYESGNIKVLSSEKNGGYGYAINTGCKYLVDSYGDMNIIISNSDIEIESEDVIKELIDGKEDGYAIVGPSIREKDGYRKGWKLPTPMVDVSLNIVYLHRIFKPKFMYYPESHYQNKYADVEAVLGCFFLIDSKALREVNYFDENVFLYGEEDIIGKKMMDAGYKTRVLCNTEVFHNHSVSIDKSVNKIRKYNLLHESQYYFQKVYMHANTFERILYKLTTYISGLILRVYYLLKK